MDFDEFVNFYQSISTTKARRELRSALGPQAESKLRSHPAHTCGKVECFYQLGLRNACLGCFRVSQGDRLMGDCSPAEDLKKIFYSFASFGVRQHVDEMDGAKFSKLCRDCKLLSRNFTTIDVDLIFAKTKVKASTRTALHWNHQARAAHLHHRVTTQLMLCSCSSCSPAPMGHHTTDAVIKLRLLTCTNGSPYNCCCHQAQAAHLHRWVTIQLMTSSSSSCSPAPMGHYLTDAVM